MIKPTLVLTWVFEARRQRVFDVFTQVEHLSRWFVRDVAIDLQVGGKLTTGEGDKGEFVKVAVPRRLIFSYAHPQLPVQTEVDLTFHETGPLGGTRVRMVQKGLDPKQVTPEAYRWQEDRWNWMADNLQRYLDRESRIDFDAWRKATRRVAGTRQ